MTFREFFTDRLTEQGLWEDESAEVIASYLSSEVGEPMNGRFDDSMEDYPKTLLVGVWLGIKDAARNWIDKNKPQHFARLMFE